MNRILEYKFLFKELVKRDFKKKYKGTILGMLWSVLYPLLDLLILVLIFTRLLGRDTPHYPIYIFCGTVLMSYFRESTKEGLGAFRNNRSIIKKIKIPNLLFVFSKNVSSLFNFLLTLLVFIVLCIIDGIEIKLMFVLLIFPIICITLFNVGVSLILSTCYVLFRDVSYLYDLLLIIINYLSAVFYNVASFPLKIRALFLLNPLFCYIQYFRQVVIYQVVPNLLLHGLCLFYGLFYLSIGLIVYYKNRKNFIYYL